PGLARIPAFQYPYPTPNACRRIDQMGFLQRNDVGGTLVEYALVMPLLMTLIVGAVDLSYMLFQWQGAVKGAHIGARLAIVMDRAAPNLANFDGTGNGSTAKPGDACMTIS